MRHMGPAAGVSSPGSQAADTPRVVVLSFCFIKSYTGGFNEAEGTEGDQGSRARRRRRRDPGTPPDAARAIHQNLPGSELKILPSAAHLSNIEQADEFNKAMTGFLNRVA